MEKAKPQPTMPPSSTTSSSNATNTKDPSQQEKASFSTSPSIPNLPLAASAHDMTEMALFNLPPTFIRRFNFLAMLGFNSLVVLAWQSTLVTFSFALINGGTGGFFFTYIYAMIAFGFTYTSLAELASSYPTAGGQFQWIAQCAPLRFSRGLSYCVGWLCSLGWVCYLSASGVFTGNLVRSGTLLYYPDSPAANSQWYPTLFALFQVVVGAVFNGRLARHFPALEAVMVVVHFATWLAFIVVLWSTSPIGSAKEVILTFNNGGGWVNPAGASLVGILTGASSLLGYDSGVHMSENARDASYTVPWSLVIAYFSNAVMAFTAGVTVIFCAGDLQAVLANDTQTPFVTIFRNSTGSEAGTILILVPIMLCILCSQISETATACRQIWAFARDDGLPFSRKLKHVPDAEVPYTALWTVIVAVVAITSINFGSAVGFNAIVSLSTVSISCSYLITLPCLIWKRLRGGGIPRARFSLGRWGLWVNIVALCMMSPIVVLAPFPSEAHVTASNMNYAVLVFGVVIAFSAINYIVVGRKRFRPTLRKAE